MPIVLAGEGSLNRVDAYILALLRAQNGEPLPGKIYLQKEMFLLQRAFPDLQGELDFEPYFLGPHSAILEDEADQLERSDLLVDSGGRISLTEKGRRAGDRAVRALGADVVTKIEEFKRFLNDLTNDELLAFIYFGYPETDVERESVEFKRLSRIRDKLARSLFARGKLTASRAAEIAGQSLEDFIESVDRQRG